MNDDELKELRKHAENYKTYGKGRITIAPSKVLSLLNEIDSLRKQIELSDSAMPFPWRRKYLR